MDIISKYKWPLLIFGLVIVCYVILVLLAGTFSPILIQSTDEMVHHFNYNSWMDEFALCDGINCTQEIYLQGYGITKRSFLHFPFVDGIKKGSIVFISKSRNVDQGDVIIIRQEGKRVLTRILEIQEGNDGNILLTKTDMAPFIENQDKLLLRANKKDSYIGKALFKI